MMKSQVKTGECCRDDVCCNLDVDYRRLKIEYNDVKRRLDILSEEVFFFNI